MTGWAVLVAAALVGGQAEAAVVTRSFNVTASKFGNFLNEASPFATLDVDFTVTYDDSKGGFFGAPSSFRAVTDGVTNAGAFSTTPIAGYFPADGMSRSPRIGIGGELNGGNVLLYGTNDFYIAFQADDFRFAGSTVTFSTAATKASFVSTNAIVRETTGLTAAVPEPATWLMLLSGFAATGAALRRRPRRALA